MDPNELIRKKFDVRRMASPPILCWMGTGRHKLHNASVGRNLLAELFAELGYTKGAEIGVDRAYYSVVMLEKNPSLSLVLVDAWQGQRGGEHCLDAYKRLAPYREVGRVDIQRDKSLIVAKTVPPDSLDFVYIDSQRDFNAVMMDLIEWGRKVRPGGMISGRGYCHLFETGVVRAVDAYTEAHYIRDFYITRDIEPNYFFIKTGKT
jgi:hypothetical protein